MKLLSRNELKSIVGGNAASCQMYACDCGFQWHPEWGQWEKEYCSVGQEMLDDVWAYCGIGGPPPNAGGCTPMWEP